MGVKREANIVIVGNYNVGKKNIATNFTGETREGVIKEVGWSEQMVTKREHDVVTNAAISIKSTPHEFGRMVNHRLRDQTLKEAQGFVVVFHNTETRKRPSKEEPEGMFDFQWYIRNEKENKKPLLLIGTSIDGNVKKNEEIQKYADSVGANYIVLDTRKLNEKDENYKLMEKSIRNLVFTIFKEPLITDESAEKKITSPTAAPTTPLPTSLPEKKPIFGDILDSMKEMFKKPRTAKTA